MPRRWRPDAQRPPRPTKSASSSCTGWPISGRATPRAGARGARTGPSCVRARAGERRSADRRRLAVRLRRAATRQAQRVASFEPLPHFTGAAWQGGAAWPDGKLGWVQLTAAGGHPGNDLAHAAIRRWTAPRDMHGPRRVDADPRAPSRATASAASSSAAAHGLLQSSRRPPRARPNSTSSRSTSKPATRSISSSTSATSSTTISSCGQSMIVTAAGRARRSTLDSRARLRRSRATQQLEPVGATRPGAARGE